MVKNLKIKFRKKCEEVSPSKKLKVKTRLIKNKCKFTRRVKFLVIFAVSTEHNIGEKYV